MKGFEFTTEEIAAIAGGILIAGIAVFGFFHELTIETGIKAAVAGLVAITAREIGQRFTGTLMRAEVNTNFSPRGSMFSLFLAAGAFLIEAPLALILPVNSDFDQTSYDLWGMDIDVMWPKREYWLGAMGIVSVLIAWIPFYLAGLTVISKGLGLFALSQLIPLNDVEAFDGTTDGAYVILHSDLVWVSLIALSLIAVALPLSF